MAYVDPETGQVYDPKDWIISEYNGRVTKVRRLSDKQLVYIESLERQLGYIPKSHRNLPAYKASALIGRLQDRLRRRSSERP